LKGSLIKCLLLEPIKWSTMLMKFILKWFHTKGLNTNRKRRSTICNLKELKKCLNKWLKCILELSLIMLMNITLNRSHMKRKSRFLMRLKSMYLIKELNIRMLLVNIRDLSRELNKCHIRMWKECHKLELNIELSKEKNRK